jgi:hypothetical protein
MSDNGAFDMEKAELSDSSDFPEEYQQIKDEADLPAAVKEACAEGEASTQIEDEKLDITTVSLTELLSLYGMEEEVAVKIKELVDEEEITSFDELKTYDFITEQHLKKWSKSFA